jgi:hypothetical protein
MLYYLATIPKEIWPIYIWVLYHTLIPFIAKINNNVLFLATELSNWLFIPAFDETVCNKKENESCLPNLIVGLSIDDVLLYSIIGRLDYRKRCDLARKGGQIFRACQHL